MICRHLYVFHSHTHDRTSTESRLTSPTEYLDVSALITYHNIRSFDNHSYNFTTTTFIKQTQITRNAATIRRTSATRKLRAEGFGPTRSVLKIAYILVTSGTEPKLWSGCTVSTTTAILRKCTSTN